MSTPQSRCHARRRAARVAAGQCTDCGTEADRYRCDECNKIMAALNRASWKRRKEKR